jgi:hypothetical protein
MPSSTHRAKRRRHHKRRAAKFGTEIENISLDRPLEEDDRTPEPKIIEFKIPWDILETYIQPLVINREIKNEFSGSIHVNGDHEVHGAEQVESTSCSSEFVCMQRASIVRGVGDSAPFFDDIQYTYHTHPTYYYTEYGVKIAPPSGEDIGVFLRGCIEEKSCVHLVVAKEGIYYIIPNPCFVHQARRLKKLNERLYNIALVGAEILGMQTHECRDSWTPQRWLEWVNNRFVCSEMAVHEYADEIRAKFNHHCDSCTKIASDDALQWFHEEFLKIVNKFMLSMCKYTNPIIRAHWGRGNWISVGFKTWNELRREQGLHVQYSQF